MYVLSNIKIVQCTLLIIAVVDDANMPLYMHHLSNVSAVILFTAIARTRSKNYITDVAANNYSYRMVRLLVEFDFKH